MPQPCIGASESVFKITRSSEPLRASVCGRGVTADERRAVEPEAHRVKPTLYLGMDGTGIPVRKAETAQRQGKQPDGSAKTREVKLAVAWTAERRHPKTGIPMRDPSHPGPSHGICGRPSTQSCSRHLEER